MDNRPIDNMITLEFMSLSENEAFARAAAAAFIAPLDPTIEELADVRTAVSEAVTNAVIHGYKKSVGMIKMVLRLRGRELFVEVSDEGCGIENVEKAMQIFYTTGNRAERTGMGFAVMGAFMDSLKVESRLGEGTSVRMQKHISRSDEAEEDA